MEKYVIALSHATQLIKKNLQLLLSSINSTFKNGDSPLNFLEPECIKINSEFTTTKYIESP